MYIQTKTKNHMSPERQSVSERLWSGVDAQLRSSLKEARETIEGNDLERTDENLVSIAAGIQSEVLSDLFEDDEVNPSQLCGAIVTKALLDFPSASRIQRDMSEGATVSNDDFTKMIEFNHSLSEALTLLPKSATGRFTESMWARALNLYKRHLDMEILNQGEFYSLVNGMSREVAFARAVKSHDDVYKVRYSSADEDRRGIDIVITNEIGRLNIDVKASAAFKSKLDDLTRRGSITGTDAVIARQQGYLSPAGTFEGYIVDADRLGNIDSFDYENPATVEKLVDDLFENEKARRATKARMGSRALR